MKIEQLMTKDVRSCTPESSLNEVARIMWEHDCGCVPVVTADQSGRVVGILTDRDVCMAAYTRGRRLVDIAVSEVMSDEVVTCAGAASLDEAEALMRGARVRRLPVVDEAGQLLGLLSFTDVLRWQQAKPKQITKGRICDTLGAITASRSQEEATIL